jgi:hypothetical protein
VTVRLQPDDGSRVDQSFTWADATATQTPDAAPAAGDAG